MEHDIERVKFYTEFGSILNKHQLEELILKLDKFERRFRQLNTFLLGCFVAGWALFISYQVASHYIHIDGLTDLLAFSLIIVLIAVPLLSYFAFGSTRKRIHNYVTLLKQFTKKYPTNNYVVLFNCWGQNAKMVGMHEGGYIGATHAGDTMIASILYKGHERIEYDQRRERTMHRKLNFSFLCIHKMKPEYQLAELFIADKRMEKLKESSVSTKEIKLEDQPFFTSSKLTDEKLQDAIRSFIVNN